MSKFDVDTAQALASDASLGRSDPEFYEAVRESLLGAVRVIRKRDGALRSIAEFEPTPENGDPYQQIAVFAKKTARASVRLDADE